MTSTIHSIKDERIVLARALNSRKGRQVHGKVLLEGEQIVHWAIERGVHVEYVLTTLDSYAPPDLDVYHVSEGIQKKVTNTRYVIPVVGVGRIPPDPVDPRAEFVVVLDGVQDFGNLGTIIRTCQAFGIRDLISAGEGFDGYQRKTIDASRGSVFDMRVARFTGPEQTIAYLRERGYQIVATSPRGTAVQSLVELDQRPVALVVGNESTGISLAFEEQADVLVQIPMSEAIESLNVGVATGISVYELRLKQVLSMIEQHIKSTLGRELNVAGMLVQKALDAELRKVSELTSRQVIFMMVLKCDQRMPVEDMCRQFGILETEVDGFLCPLVDGALVVRDRDLHLTDKGAEVLAKLWFKIEATESQILSGLTLEERVVFMRQLATVQQRCIEIVDGM